MRLLALCKKEFKLILRDPSSMLITVFLPIMLLIIYGYGINLDTSKINLALIDNSHTKSSSDFINSMLGSGFIELKSSQNPKEAQKFLDEGKVRGILYIDDDFDINLMQNKAKIFLVTDGSEPNIANFLQNYINAIFALYLEQKADDEARKEDFHINLESIFWFNKTTDSRNFILPGSICIIMTVIGAILTSLVVAKEYESGSFETLISTPITKIEFLLSKFLPYFILALIALSICLFVAIYIIKVPFVGSLFLMYLTSCIFIFVVLVIGLIISTLTKNQFNAAMIAMNFSFLPSVMLSGFVFDIVSMPKILQISTFFFPARYYIAIIQNLFLAGNVFNVLLINSLFLTLFFVIISSLLFKVFKLKMD